MRAGAQRDMQLGGGVWLVCKHVRLRPEVKLSSHKKIDAALRGEEAF